MSASWTASVLCACVGVVLLSSPDGRADCDKGPPALLDLSLSPRNVDVTNGPQDVTCTLVIGDQPSGISRAECAVSFYQSRFSCVVTEPVTPRGGTFSCPIRIPRYAPGSSYDVDVSLVDRVGNATAFDSSDLSSLGLPDGMSVNDAASDRSEPLINAFDLNPKAVNVDGASAQVTCSLDVSDSPAGIAEAGCRFLSPVHGHMPECTVQPTGGPTAGTFTCSVTIPRYAENGIWGVFSIRATDTVGNRTLLYSYQMAQRGFPTALSVTSHTPDTTAPALDDFGLSPTVVDVAHGPAAVTCRMRARDSLAGIASARCSVESAVTRQVASCSSSVPQSGVYQCDLLVPEHAEDGRWGASVTLSDAADNVLEVATSELQARGFPSGIDVACESGETEVSLRWSGPATLVWTPVSAASRYGVYRGQITYSGLRDSNNDGSVDRGLGACRNDHDPDTGDTTFVDEEVAAPRTAFFYLVTYVPNDGVETLLGTGSKGLTRSSGSPCF